jgi:hypothetical protein
MTSTQAFGVGYSLWIRGKTAFIGAWAYLALLVLALRLVPVLGIPRDRYHIVPIIFAVPLLLVPVIAMMNALAFGPIDLNAKASPFPLHTRLLPIRTREMVGLPMAIAVVAIVSLWLALSLLVLRPTGIATGVIWPAVTLGALVLWFQAMSWVPCPWRFIRMPLLLLSVGLPILCITVDPRSGDYYWTHVSCMAIWGVLAFMVANFGLGRARIGAGLNGNLASKTEVSSSDVKALSPFESASKARLWYEYRRNGSFFVKLSAYFGLPLVVYSVISLISPRAALVLWIGGRAPTPCVSMLADIFCLFFPILMSASLGGFLGRFDFWKTDRLSPFFAIRPVSTTRLVGDKLISASGAVLALVVATLVVHAAGYSAWFHFAPDSVRSEELDRYLQPGYVFNSVLVVIAFAFVLWRNLVTDMWTTMTGRKWVSDLVAALSPIGLFFIPAFYGWSLGNQPARDWLKGAAPYFFAALLLAKLVLASGVAKRLVDRRLASTALLGRVVALWFGVTVAGTALVSHLIGFSSSAAFVVALVVPLARIGIAPLALDANRHG